MPIYETAYAEAKNLINGNNKIAARQYASFCKLGKNNPAQAKLISRVAVFDALGDYAIKTPDTNINPYKTVFKFVKNIIKEKLFHSKHYKFEKKAFDKAYQELYPKTHKMRDKLLNKGKVRLEHKFELQKNKIIME